jgi:hypothetical protein
MLGIKKSVLSSRFQKYGLNKILKKVTPEKPLFLPQKIAKSLKIDNTAITFLRTFCHYFLLLKSP